MKIERKGRQLWVLERDLLHEDKKWTLSWVGSVPDGLGTKHQRNRLISTAKLLFENAFGESNPRGRTFAPATLALKFRVLKTLMRWMAQRNVWMFSELDLDDITDFIVAREGVQKDSISEKTVSLILGVLHSLWEVRDVCSGTFSFDPLLAKEAVLKTGIEMRPIAPWPAMPEEAAVRFIAEAFYWIREVGPFVIETLEARWEAQNAMIGKAQHRRSADSRVFYRKLAEDPRFIDAVDRLSFQSKRTYKMLSHLITVCEGAAAFLLLCLVGFRASELVSLNEGCLVAQEGDSPPFIVGRAAKADRDRVWVAGHPVPEIIDFLSNLTKHVRGGHRVKTKGLLLVRPVGAPTFVPRRSVHRWDECSLARRLKEFFAIRAAEGFQIDFHPHMGRKTFAKLAVIRNRKNLEAVSAQLGHVYAWFTDGKYVGVDHELAELLDQADREALASGLEKVLTSTNVFGGASGALEEMRKGASRFRGKGALKSKIDELIRQGVKLAPCDWGYCVYSKAHSACDGNDAGPNEAKRSPDVCSTCKNFAITEHDISWWDNRVTREQAFLERNDLSDQTRSVVQLRLNNSLSLLKKSVIQKMRPKAEEVKNG
ncbi:hypothetical protein [Roseateles sp. MS654]|uniref:hypothetical protein n=1 Tax=Roseateles sp. MS654 TaxID=3412685 RepID=UPI003C2E0136